MLDELIYCKDFTPQVTGIFWNPIMEGALFVPEVRRLQITVLTLQFYDQSVQCTYFHVDSSHL